MFGGGVAEAAAPAWDAHTAALKAAYYFWHTAAFTGATPC